MKKKIAITMRETTLKENKEVYEGEVTELTPEETEGMVRGTTVRKNCLLVALI